MLLDILVCRAVQMDSPIYLLHPWLVTDASSVTISFNVTDKVSVTNRKTGAN